MKLKVQARHIGRLIQESSPTILTAVGVVGVVGTAVLVGKAAFKSHEVVTQEGIKKDHAIMNKALEEGTSYTTGNPLTLKEQFLHTWKFYLPAVGVGSLTIAAIIASNRIHARRLAALAAGYAILSKDFDEYRDKAFEKLGIKKSDELDKDIASGKIASSPPAPGGVLPQGKTWFCDMSSMRYFPSTMETVKGAQNDLNYTLNNNSDVSVNDWYEKVGLDSTTIGDLLGWKPTQRVEIVPKPLLVDEYGAVTAIQFRENPVPKFWRHDSTST